MKQHCLVAFALIFLPLAGICANKPAPDWSDSKWIAMERDLASPNDPNGKFIHHWTSLDIARQDTRIGDYALPEFRKEFRLRCKPRKATAYVCGLGQFELYVNGAKVGDHFLDPGWTQYDKEVLYVQFDVLPYLNKKNNALTVTLGNGFFNIPNERYYKITGSFGAPRLRMVLELEYPFGIVKRIVTDGNWKVHRSPLTFSSIYRGECYDATMEIPGVGLAGFDDSSWQAALELSDFTPAMLPQLNAPVKVVAELAPVASWQCDGGTIYDMGQNFSGIFRIVAKGETGSKVRVWPSEKLADGKVNQMGTGTPMFYEYTLRGAGQETWQPRFSYYGQRYFFVEGDAEVLDFVGLHTSADLTRVGSFRCSNELFNDVYRITDWAFRSNAASVFTDCPHREKLGWQEQSWLMFPSFAHMYDVRNQIPKALEDMACAQRADGCIPTIAPEYVRFEDGFEDTPEWGSALLIGAWNMYEWYGESEYIGKYYPQMQKYLSYLDSRKDIDGVLAYGLGDWLTVDERTALGITSHLVYCRDLELMSAFAGMLGLEDDKAKYEEAWKSAAAAFNTRFWNDGAGVYDKGTQADCAMPLYFGVVPPERRERVYASLLEAVESAGAVTTGEVAHPMMLSLLSAHGDDAVISRMHTQTEKPGYAYMLSKGVTTLTEAWDGSLSQNHFANGHIVDWFYSSLAGIRQEEGSTGFSRLVIEPRTVPEVDWVECSFDSPSGKVVSDWKKTDSGVSYHIVIPDGVDATLKLSGEELKVGAGTYEILR